jgi:hypothetical protein
MLQHTIKSYICSCIQLQNYEVIMIRVGSGPVGGPAESRDAFERALQRAGVEARVVAVARSLIAIRRTSAALREGVRDGVGENSRDGVGENSKSLLTPSVELPPCGRIPLAATERPASAPELRCFGVSVFRCFGVSVFRCFGVSVFRCFGVSVFRCFGGSVVRCSGGSVVRWFGVWVFGCFGGSLVASGHASERLRRDGKGRYRTRRVQ